MRSDIRHKAKAVLSLKLRRKNISSSYYRQRGDSDYTVEFRVSNYEPDALKVLF